MQAQNQSQFHKKGNFRYAEVMVIVMNGRFDFLVLHLLSKEEMYGFQIIKKISDSPVAELELKTGTLYPLLRVLEDNGFLTARFIPIHGRNRKVYKITDLGLEYLALQKEKWFRYSSIVNKMLEL